MAIVTFNSNSLPDILLGASGVSSNVINSQWKTTACIPCITKAFIVASSLIPQVAGLVPLNPCCAGEVAQGGSGDCGCEGQFTGDVQPNTFDYVLPVFVNTPNGTDDFNYWLLSYPMGYDAILSGDFTLQEWNGTAWVIKATLNNTTYGIPYNNGLSGSYYFTSCQATGNANNNINTSVNVNYQGYSLNWKKVYTAFGAGIYRFVVSGVNTMAGTYCSMSPPFCLNEGTCVNMDRTIQFKAIYCGGTVGDSSNDQGNLWQLCMTNSNTQQQNGSSQFKAESNNSTDTETTIITPSYCAGDKFWSIGFGTEETFRTVDYNMGSLYDGTSTYTADTHPTQVFSGQICVTVNTGGGTLQPNSSTIVVGLNINGVEVASQTIPIANLASGCFAFSFPPTDGLAGHPPPLNPSDKVSIKSYVNGMYEICPVDDAPISIGTSGSYWMNTLIITNGTSGSSLTYPMTWSDSIRVYGTIATQTFDEQKDEIKYQTGLVNPVRDEFIKKYVVKLGGNNIQKLPWWFFDRFVYYLMGDTKYVSDSNLNNPDYTIINRQVIYDSGLTPKFTGDSRLGKVDDLVFKDGIQAIYRDRCCS